MDNCLWSIVQTQAVNNSDEDISLPGWVPAKGKNPDLNYHPVWWVRIGEPFENYIDAIFAREELPNPENYIILPHY